MLSSYQALIEPLLSLRSNLIRIIHGLGACLAGPWGDFGPKMIRLHKERSFGETFLEGVSRSPYQAFIKPVLSLYETFIKALLSNYEIHMKTVLSLY